MSVCLSVCLDSPQITCHVAEAEVGERNVCLRCDVRAKPVATTIFWIVADNGSSVLAGQVTDDYWVVIKVYITSTVDNSHRRHYHLSSHVSLPFNGLTVVLAFLF